MKVFPAYDELVKGVESVEANCRAHGVAHAARDLTAKACQYVDALVDAVMSNMRGMLWSLRNKLQYHITLAEGEGCSIVQASDYQHALYRLQHGLAVVSKVTRCLYSTPCTT
jgi:hypothetical protein